MNLIEYYKKSVEKQNTPIIKTCKADLKEHPELIAFIAGKNEPKFKFTDKNKPVYRMLMLYFTGNADFNSYMKQITGRQGNLDKGLLVVGNVGSGKTYSLATVFKEYTANVLRKNSYQVHDYYSIIRNFELLGSEALSIFGFQQRNMNGYQKDRTLTVLIDDFLSTKSTVSHFGNKTDIPETLINQRYEAYKRGRKLTHFTMNLYPNELGDLLDERSISRLQEMCNVIALEDCDWRKV